MLLSELKNAGRNPGLPLSLELADAAGPAQLQLLTLLRVLPGQRYVGAGIWRGRPVLAKLLVGSKAPDISSVSFKAFACWRSRG